MMRLLRSYYTIAHDTHTKTKTSTPLQERYDEALKEKAELQAALQGSHDEGCMEGH
jgi:hypothetical protein